MKQGYLEEGTLVSHFSPAITAFWARPFAGEIIHSGERLTLTVNPALGHEERVTVLQSAADVRTAFALSPDVARALESEGMRADLPGLDEQRVRNALAAIGVELHGADNIYYFPQGSEAVEDRERILVRQLSANDHALFADFEERASEQDRDDAQVDLDDWAAFGVIVDDRLVSAASTYPFRGSMLADVGVLTLAEVRGKGHGRRLVHAAAHHARGLGYELQYRCQLDNAASKALAEAAGLRLFGRWEVPTPPLDGDA